MAISLPLRIAILECDTPFPQTHAKYGGYGGVFHAFLRSGADLLQHPGLSSTSGLELTFWDVVTAQEYPPLSSIDAILVTGSLHNSFSNEPWIVKLVAFTKEVLAQRRVRVIGVCFGHQIVGRALGVEVGKNPEGWETSIMPMGLTEKGKKVFGRDSLALHQMHRDVVYSYPTGVEILAQTDKCSVQSMYVAKQLLTMQGHPEFTAEIVTEIIYARHAAGIFDDALFEDGIARVQKEHDGAVVAVAFLRFLLDD